MTNRDDAACNRQLRISAGHSWDISRPTRRTDQLYLWLNDSSDPNKHAMQAAMRPQIFGVSEFESDEGVHNIEVAGFIFRYAANFPQRRRW